jgi:hypothetical protein
MTSPVVQVQGQVVLVLVQV